MTTLAKPTTVCPYCLGKKEVLNEHTQKMQPCYDCGKKGIVCLLCGEHDLNSVDHDCPTAKDIDPQDLGKPDAY